MILLIIFLPSHSFTIYTYFRFLPPSFSYLSRILDKYKTAMLFPFAELHSARSLRWNFQTRYRGKRKTVARVGNGDGPMAKAILATAMEESKPKEEYSCFLTVTVKIHSRHKHTFLHLFTSEPVNPSASKLLSLQTAQRPKFSVVQLLNS